MILLAPIYHPLKTIIDIYNITSSLKFHQTIFMTHQRRPENLLKASSKSSGLPIVEN